MKLGGLLKYDTPEKRATLCKKETCDHCNSLILDDLDRCFYMNKLVCADCYYAAFGQLVEEYPIGGHRR